MASPGESSLKAALSPATSDYLYYVRNPARDDGAHNFYSNGAEFETGVAALRKWERERDAEEARKKRANGNPRATKLSPKETQKKHKEQEVSCLLCAEDFQACL